MVPMAEKKRSQPAPEREKQPAKPEKPASTPAAEVFFWAQALALALAVLVLINTFLFRLSGVHGDSMNPTLADGEQTLLRLHYRPQRGDIVVCYSKNLHEALVKRVVGLAGDTIDIDAQGCVVLNGQTLYEPYIAANIIPEKRGDHSYPLTVQPGHVFVMGDNRNGSLDSRWDSVGQIAEEDIIGKAVFRIWPLNHLGGLS